MRIINAVNLQKKTNLALEECERLIEQLKLNGLCIIDNTEEFLSICNNMEDDGK
jgi:hypothetical protein